MKKLLVGITFLFIIISLISCQKQNINKTKDLKSNLTLAQVNSRNKLKQTALIMAKIVNDKAINKEIFKQIEAKRKGLYRVSFNSLFDESSLKTGNKINFKEKFAKVGAKYLNEQRLKSGNEETDTSLTIGHLIQYLEDNDINIYWPYSQNWNGTEIPTVTYQPYDNLDENEGFIQSNPDRLKTTNPNDLTVVNVNDNYAYDNPTLIIDNPSIQSVNNLELYDPSKGDFGSSSGTLQESDGNYDVNKIFIYKVRTNGKNFRGLFGGENVITFYRGGEELVNTTTPSSGGMTFAIDRWAGRNGVWREVKVVWDENWLPGEVEQWIGVKLHKVKEGTTWGQFGGDISLNANATGKVAKSPELSVSNGYTVKLFSWTLNVLYEDFLGKNNKWNRKQFFYENWQNADLLGTLDGICIRAAGNPNDSKTRGAIMFTMYVKSYNYE